MVVETLQVTSLHYIGGNCDRMIGIVGRSPNPPFGGQQMLTYSSNLKNIDC
ncbi:hypothetical protein [Chroococcidiopsis sp. SAG 2025]|uniref:hypothetical protein n=1 Tax=Chroococcidiopsis sp. SAG 2025 TaxID=171389 RepID=UPI002936FA5F|nr:hypothetical protein [Chroococcidiopsis sp. SAG 2025]